MKGVQAEGTTGPPAGGADPGPAAEVTEPDPLKDRRFLVFATGNAFNNVGEALYATTLPLLVYHLTGSLAVMAWLAAVVPAASLLAPVFGAWADRRGVTGLVFCGLLAQAAAALAMNLLLLGGHSAPWLLFVCALVVETGAIVYRTGWMTGVPAQFPASPVRARGTLNSLFLAATLAGPLLVAVLLPAVGYEGLLWCNLPTFFAPLAVWVIGCRPPSGPAGAPPARGGTPFSLRRWTKAATSPIREGWHAIAEDRRVTVLLVVEMVLDAVCGVGLTVLIVYHLRHGWTLSGQQASFAIAAMNVASLVGNVLVSQRRRLRPWTPLTLGVAARSVALVLMTVPVWPVFVAAVVLGALGQGAVMATVVMARVRYLPPHVLGRASGLIWLLTGAAALLSPILVPVLDDAAGTSLTFLVLGIATSTLLLHLRRNRSVWKPEVPLGTGGPRTTNEP